MNNIKVDKKSLDGYKFDNVICSKQINDNIVKRLTGKVNLYLTPVSNKTLLSELWFIISLNDKIKLMTKDISSALRSYNDDDKLDIIKYTDIPYKEKQDLIEGL